ncbi:8836_t:CDS:2 [Paraglomus brasilianum]|uniref:8836_t:CDS:1 n=1 Tax=Paraglomus brasilianum TaxID=144538 RepID=A0A9N8WEX9_9GLOM|nr:8836_t:CDS:2 [Paraglomus brasilianum]
MAKSFIALSLFILFNVANAALPGTWPAVDQPVAAVAAWSSLVDMSKVTKAPQLNQTTTCAQVSSFCRSPCGCNRPSDILNCPTKKDWGLSFDDGPSPYTSRLVDFLDSQKIKATFFVVGSRVYQFPEVLKKIYDSGHDIAVHTWSHTALTSLSNEQIIAEIKYTELAIQQAINVTTRTVRPPYGDCDDRVRDILGQLGYKIILWDRDASDFLANSNPNFNVNWIPGNFTQWIATDTGTTGHISLEHDLYQKTALAAESVVPVLQKAQYNIVPAATCTTPGATSTTSNTTTDAATSTPASISNDPQSGSSQSNAVSLDKSIASLFTTCLITVLLFYQTFL